MSLKENMLNLLCIEDSENDFILFRSKLKNNSFFEFNAKRCDRLKKIKKYTEEESFDIIFLDLHLPDSKASATLDYIFSRFKNVPIIVMTDSSDPEYALQAIDQGAQDYIIKGQWDADTLARAILLAIRRKRFESKMIAEKEDAEKISRFKSEFLANMSHEIRTPMNGVVGMASIMEPKNDEQAQQLETIRLSAGHLLSIVNNVLDMSKIEAGMLDFDQEQIEIRPIFDEVLDIFSEQACRKNVNLFNKVNKDVPKAIQGDSTYIRQICCNLINNALKFTENGSVYLNAKIIENDFHKKHLYIEVRDTGIGIDKQQLAKVFKTFEQADTTVKKNYGGSGLGLAICKQLVELMDGKIGVKSTLSEGSTFWFQLPLEKIDLEFSSRPDLKLQSVTVISDCTESLSYFEEILSMRSLVPKMIHYTQDSPIEPIDKLSLVIVDLLDSSLIESIISKVPEHSIFIYSKNQCLNISNEYIKISRPYKQSEIYKALAYMIAPEIIEPSYRTKHETFSLRALVAEDDTVNQLVTKKILCILGLDVDIANTGTQAVAMVEGGNYDLVFMDCHMPEMDGYEAAQKIRQLNDPKKSSIPIIALTADALLGAENSCISAGMNSYLSKPVELEAIKEKISQVISSSLQ